MSEQCAILDAYGRPIAVRSTLGSPDAWLIDALGGGTKSTANEVVNSRTAMTVMTFFACVRNISEDMTKLPKVVKRTDGRNNNAVPEHPVSRLMKNPSRYFDRHTFWLTYFSHVLTHKGAFAYIVRDQQTGAPAELLLLDPDNVRAFASETTGEPMFHVHGATLFSHEVLHLRGLGEMGINGYSITYLARQVLGAAIAMQKTRGSFFGNGMMMSGILTHPLSLGDDAKISLARQFKAAYAGADNAGGVVLLDEGFKYEPTSVNPKDSEFAALNDISVLDICRAFRMPPHKVQHLNDAHYNNIEELNLDYKGDTIDPWADRFRSEVEFKLVPRQERDAGLYLDVNLKALERGNLSARKDFYNFMYYSGAYSANRILELEHENTVPDGDRYFVQGNLVPADRVDDFLDSKTSPTETPAGPAGPAPQPPTPRQSAEDPSGVFIQMVQAKVCQLLREESRHIEQRDGKKWNYAEFFAKRKTTMAAHIAPFLFPLCEWYGCTVPGGALADGIAATLCKDSLTLLESGDYPNWNPDARAVDAAQMILDSILTQEDSGDEQDPT